MSDETLIAVERRAVISAIAELSLRLSDAAVDDDDWDAVEAMSLSIYQLARGLTTPGRVVT